MCVSEYMFCGLTKNYNLASEPRLVERSNNYLWSGRKKKISRDCWHQLFETNICWCPQSLRLKYKSIIGKHLNYSLEAQLAARTGNLHQPRLHIHRILFEPIFEILNFTHWTLIKLTVIEHRKERKLTIQTFTRNDNVKKVSACCRRALLRLHETWPIIDCIRLRASLWRLNDKQIGYWTSEHSSWTQSTVNSALFSYNERKL